MALTVHLSWLEYVNISPQLILMLSSINLNAYIKPNMTGLACGPMTWYPSKAALYRGY